MARFPDGDSDPRYAVNLAVSAQASHDRPRKRAMTLRAFAVLLAALASPVLLGPIFGDRAQARSPRITPDPEVTANATLASVSEEPRATALPTSAAGCPKEMVLVEGEYCTDVAQTCTRWLDDPTLPFARCAEYASPARCVGEKVSMRYCIDRYEYTKPGEELPMNYASFNIASETCASLGKRVCNESEWNFACEGEEMRPYPYGFSRESKCNQDRDDLFEKNPHRQVLADRREPADARPECVSAFGVYDMTGNMDEPVQREGAAHAPPFSNALKGGWWMPARNRCRPATTAHDDYYKDIQVGVRCCAAAD
ncbi:MAG TPA: SUMF1/EgtB/PvdO family nonheme iron enzyme [Polyangiaceae bacterium]|jgi:hypothetical protein